MHWCMEHRRHRLYVGYRLRFLENQQTETSVAVPSLDTTISSTNDTAPVAPTPPLDTTIPSNDDTALLKAAAAARAIHLNPCLVPYASEPPPVPTGIPFSDAPTSKSLSWNDEGTALPYPGHAGITQKCISVAEDTEDQTCPPPRSCMKDGSCEQALLMKDVPAYVSRRTHARLVHRVRAIYSTLLAEGMPTGQGHMSLTMNRTAGHATEVLAVRWFCDEQDVLNSWSWLFFYVSS